MNMLKDPTNFDDMEQRLIDEFYQSLVNNSKNDKRKYLGMSLIGDDCLRKIWYSFRAYDQNSSTKAWNPNDPEGRKFAIFKMGDKVEELVIDTLRSAGYEIQGQQDSFQDMDSSAGFLFRGHCDGILIDDLGQKKFILEIKSANKNRFEKFQKTGVKKNSPTYFAQVQLYMHYSRISESIFVILNKDDCSLYTERIHYQSIEALELIQKAKKILTANEPPKRITEKESVHCTFCDFKYTCFGAGFDVQERQDCRTCKHFKVHSDLKLTCENEENKKEQAKDELEIKKLGIYCDRWRYRNE